LQDVIAKHGHRLGQLLYTQQYATMAPTTLQNPSMCVYAYSCACSCMSIHTLQSLQ
jgi:hypothetical protein